MRWILQERVYKHHLITDVEELRRCVEEEWGRLDQEVIDNVISERRKRLKPALQPVEGILNIHSEHYCICLHAD